MCGRWWLGAEGVLFCRFMHGEVHGLRYWGAAGGKQLVGSGDPTARPGPVFLSPPLPFSGPGCPPRAAALPCPPSLLFHLRAADLGLNPLELWAKWTSLPLNFKCEVCLHQWQENDYNTKEQSKSSVFSLKWIVCWTYESIIRWINKWQIYASIRDLCFIILRLESHA